MFGSVIHTFCAKAPWAEPKMRSPALKRRDVPSEGAEITTPENSEPPTHGSGGCCIIVSVSRRLCGVSRQGEPIGICRVSGAGRRSLRRRHGSRLDTHWASVLGLGRQSLGDLLGPIVLIWVSRRLHSSCEKSQDLGEGGVFGNGA